MSDHLTQEIRRTILLALNQNRTESDGTSATCVDSDASTSAHLILKQPARIAGLIILPILGEMLDNSLQFEVKIEDGMECEQGTVLAHVKGNARSILTGEKTALNLIQHASGIATLTAQCVKSVEGFNCDILDTRETQPGLRAIQKYAVNVGGGKNHRFELEERFLVKDDLIKLLRETSPKPVLASIQRAKILQPLAKIEVEISDLAMLQEALDGKADLILLNNMSLELIAEAVKINAGRAYLEVSGEIDLEKIRDYAATGINGISIGAFTHSATAIEMSLKV